jgi:hypothetical protein
MRNQLCEILSSNQLDDLTGTEIEKLAAEAFARMDRQLNLTMECILTFRNYIIFCQEDCKDI